MKTRSSCYTGEIKTRKKKLGCLSQEVKKMEKNQTFRRAAGIKPASLTWKTKVYS